MKRHVATIATLLLLATGIASAQNSIRLNPSARIAPDQPVTLGDIAEIDGPDRDHLAEIAFNDTHAPDARWFKLDIAAVRDALEGDGLNPARYTLQGANCAIRILRPVSTPTPARTTAHRDTPTAIVDPESIRAHVTRRIADALDVSTDNLRATFHKQDGDLLDRRINRPIEHLTIDLTTKSHARAIQARVVVIGGDTGDRLLLSETIVVETLVRREVLVAKQRYARHAPVRLSELSTEHRWIDAREHAVTAEEMHDVVAARSIAPETILSSTHIARPVAAERGDLVMIECINHGIKIRLKARALEDGRDGEIISFMLPNASKPFSARLSGRNYAVIRLDGRQTAPDKEHAP